jgi:hypothetical protein
MSWWNPHFQYQCCSCFIFLISCSSVLRDKWVFFYNLKFVNSSKLKGPVSPQLQKDSKRSSWKPQKISTKQIKQNTTGGQITFFHWDFSDTLVDIHKRFYPIQHIHLWMGLARQTSLTHLEVCQQQAILIASKAVGESGTLNHLAIWEEHPSFTLSGNKNGTRKFKIEQALYQTTLTPNTMCLLSSQSHLAHVMKNCKTQIAGHVNNVR